MKFLQCVCWPFKTLVTPDPYFSLACVILSNVSNRSPVKEYFPILQLLFFLSEIGSNLSTFSNDSWYDLYCLFVLIAVVIELVDFIWKKLQISELPCNSIINSPAKEYT